MTVLVPPDVLKELREAAERDRRPLSNQVLTYIETALEGQGGAAAP